MQVSLQARPCQILRHHFWWPAVLSGLLLGLSFPPVPLPGLVLIALVPLLFALERTRTPLQALLAGATATLLWVGLTLHWALRHAVPAAAFASAVGLLCLALLMALPAAIAKTVQLRRGRAAALVAFVLSWMALEALLTYGPLPFPWLQLGYATLPLSLVRGLIATLGTPALSLWVLGANVLVYALLRQRDLATGLLLAGWLLLPLGLPAPAPEPEPRTAPILVVQHGVPAATWDRMDGPERLTHLLTLTETALDTARVRPALILWPETALPDTSVLFRLRAWVAHRRIPLLTGAVVPADGPGSTRFAYTNSALLLQPDRPLGRYDKQRLVPFAEQVPLVETFPALQVLAVPAGGVAGYRSGRTPARFAVGPLRPGVLICFESFFGNLARRSAEEGANLLVVLTQDGWWGRGPVYRQHLQAARLRAIETGRAVVQVGADGLSALVLPSGRIAQELPPRRAAVRLFMAPLHEAPTPAVRLGDLLTPTVLLSLLLLLGWTFLKR
ncbi:Apolipoprotein N-acyltransferase [Rhodothermus marinus SG0.5JP17-172]|uniref:apolipoprotein N-acyltransferase n=1 Tax=Rhodothermus marinus TaxID=29549 RepID=UPI000223D9AC|nr:apolipoprotein N-acyltransferase [Rhodothermus marinus]AEN73485.1 Apolipoprotein N-acyltransferase [Rhodothermus marinus SG0.5JP17-172]